MAWSRSLGGGTGLTYKPNADCCNAPPGTTLDTFTYTATGGLTATVSMTVTCVDDLPVAVDDTPTVQEDSGATPLAVLANDTDVDGGASPVISTVTQPPNGIAIITNAGGGLTYQHETRSPIRSAAARLQLSASP